MGKYIVLNVMQEYRGGYFLKVVGRRREASVDPPVGNGSVIETPEEVLANMLAVVHQLPDCGAGRRVPQLYRQHCLKNKMNSK